MATENILIKFTSDTSGLKDSVAELQKIGKLSEEDAKKFQMMEGFAEGVADALKEAGIDAKTLNKEIGSTVNSGKSLKAQFSDAKNEAVKLSREFGATSVQARNAAKSAALLKDEIDDMNGVLKALNPEAKLNAFVNLGQGVQGAFQAATGALQVFGIENERITKLAQQFQGVLNLTQGINSVLQLKDVYTQLRLVLGVTTAAQTALTGVTATGAVVTTGAATATNTFTAALAANPFTAVAVVLATLVGAIIAYNFVTDDATEATGKLNKETEEQIKKQQELAEAYQNSTGAISKSITDSRIRLALASGDITELTAKLQQLEIDRQRAVTDFISNFGNDIVGIAEINKKFGIEAQIIRAEDAAKKLKNIPKRIFQEFTNASLKTDLAAASKELVDAINKELDKVVPIGVKIDKKGTDFNKELFEKEDKRRKESAELAVNLAIESAAFISDLNRTSTQNQINDLEEQKDKGVISEEQYQERLKKIKTDAAKRDKELAIFSATILFAEALINALTFKPANAVPTALILASVTAGLNLAKIIATPIPRFKEGTLNVGGGSLDSDGGMQAIIHRGEAIIPADRNREYHPTIKALYNRQVKASDINAFVQNKLSGKMNHNVNAKINTKELARAMDKGNTVKIENASAVGRVIANELSKGYNRRNII